MAKNATRAKLARLNPSATAAMADDPPIWMRAPELERGTHCTILVNGAAVSGIEGECLATALAASGRLILGTSPSGRARGMLCLMGACQQCVALVDGQRRTTCMVAVREGMQVRLEDGDLS